MRRTRRRLLAAGVGLAGLGGLAGCLGGGGGSGADGCEITDEPTVSELSPPVAGSPDAGVTVMAFEDFACPHCRTYQAEVLPAIREEYIDSGRIRYEHHDLPIPVDEKWSWWVASAARGVQDTVGDDAFFDFVDRAFERQDDYSLSAIADAASAVDAEPCPVQNDAANEVYRPVLETDRSRASDLGIQGTPGVVVNGRIVEASVSGIRSAVERAL
jgi:Protein-disulfide isomerase